MSLTPVNIAETKPALITTIRILEPSVLTRLCSQGSLGFGEAYSDGTLEVRSDPVEVLVALNRALARSSPSWFSRLCDRWQRTRHRHSFAESQASVFHHYDIGNEFYQQWLDEQLVYTCAYYARPDLALEEAQVAKLDHVCRKLRLQPGDTVVEAGCGWGALALHMARQESGEWVVNDAVRAKWLIGAGGKFCPVARQFSEEVPSKEHPESVILAQEVEFVMTDAQQSACEVSGTHPELYFCPDLKGYGWAPRGCRHGCEWDTSNRCRTGYRPPREPGSANCC